LHWWPEQVETLIEQLQQTLEELLMEAGHLPNRHKGHHSSSKQHVTLPR
jgi:hypothetical protein